MQVPPVADRFTIDIRFEHRAHNRRFTGQPVERVLPLLTENPARMLGIFGRKGSLEPGKDADLVVLDKALQVKATYVDISCTSIAAFACATAFTLNAPCAY